MNLSAAVGFLREVREELRRTVWPDRNEVIEATFAVVVFTAILGAYFWVLDMVFSRLIHLIISV